MTTNLPPGFQYPPVLAALAQFKAPPCQPGQWECELDGYVCHFDRPYNDGECLLDKVFMNGGRISLDALAEDFQISLMQRGEAALDKYLKHERDCV